MNIKYTGNMEVVQSKVMVYGSIPRYIKEGRLRIYDFTRNLDKLFLYSLWPDTNSETSKFLMPLIPVILFVPIGELANKVPNWYIPFRT